MKNNIHISLYWKCQLTGWAIASLYWTYQGYTGGSFKWDLAIFQFFTDVIMYIMITHVYRAFALKNRWQDLALDGLFGRMLLAIPVMGIFYAVVTVGKTYLIRELFVTHGTQRLEDFITQNGMSIFIAGIRLMAIWLLAYHLYHYARREINLSAVNAKLEIAARQAQLDRLSAQLNPHFLFNSLNTIKSLIYTKPAIAARAVDLMSELLRSGLYNGSSMLISLEEEVGLVKDYLELEQLRMEERLSFELNVDLMLSQIKVPRLSLQAIVENAVKHGVAEEKEGGRILISIFAQDGYLFARVISPGKLKKHTAGSGIGLQNLKERLAICYNGLAQLDLYETAQNVCAEIKLPIT